MPLFTFLSGYVYAFRPTEKDSILKFNLLKLRRLGLPILFIEIPFCILSFLLGSENKVKIDEISLSPLYPIGHFWFLNALLFIFMVISLIDSFKMMNSPRKSAIILVISIILFSSPLRNVNIFAIGDAFYIMPFFLLGIIVYRFSLHEINLPPAANTLALSFLILYPIYASFVLNQTPGYIRGTNMFYCLISMGLCYYIMKLEIKNTLLSFVGSFSYTIYLYHVHVLVFIKGFARKILDATVLEKNSIVIATISAILAIFISIIIHNTLSRNKITSITLLGVNKR